MSDYARVLPSDDETPSKHVFDSVNRGAIDKVVKRDLRRIATWWKKQNENVF